MHEAASSAAQRAAVVPVIGRDITDASASDEWGSTDAEAGEELPREE
ncbi:MAG: hypothetical protein LH475_12785 [Cryobacterium sp.]|nr:MULTISPECIES: hypothetical protein [unclassified Cryobacterium]MCY7405478.1 hypothetical protein [Cryobacterium sp.]MEC5153567.1 hypothetical protein [Cryobacterium sp. CAN_C3]